jgi:hypothetical protein
MVKSTYFALVSPETVPERNRRLRRRESLGARNKHLRDYLALLSTETHLSDEEAFQYDSKHTN